MRSSEFETRIPDNSTRLRSVSLSRGEGRENKRPRSSQFLPLGMGGSAALGEQQEQPGDGASAAYYEGFYAQQNTRQQPADADSSRIARLKNNLRLAAKELEDEQNRQKNLDNLHTNVAELRDANETLRCDVDDLRGENAMMRRDMAHLRGVNENLQQNEAVLRGTIENLQREVLGRMDLLQQQVGGAQQEINRNRQELDRLNARPVQQQGANADFERFLRSAARIAAASAFMLNADHAPFMESVCTWHVITKCRPAATLLEVNIIFGGKRFKYYVCDACQQNANLPNIMERRRNIVEQIDEPHFHPQKVPGPSVVVATINSPMCTVCYVNPTHRVGENEQNSVNRYLQIVCTNEGCEGRLCTGCFENLQGAFLNRHGVQWRLIARCPYCRADMSLRTGPCESATTKPVAHCTIPEFDPLTGVRHGYVPR